MSRYFNRNQNRFDNYREITARYPSTGACGHNIKPGDLIGWHSRHGACCADCWRQWSADNANAAAYESNLGPDFSPDSESY